MRMWVLSLASISGLGIWCSHKLWCRSQAQFGSRGIAVAMAVASSYSSNLTSSLGTSICHRFDPKKQTNKKNSDCNISNSTIATAIAGHYINVKLLYQIFIN